jgi:hypothetical protein
MMIFSPAVGGRRKEDTTSSIVIKQGRIIAHLDIINNLLTQFGSTCVRESLGYLSDDLIHKATSAK